jgi:hypothetical protein
MRVQLGKPVAIWSYGIYENEPANRRLIHHRRKHCDPAAPRMSEQIPPLDFEHLADARNVIGVVLYSRRTRVGRRLRLAPSTLIEEDKPPTQRERRQGGPENVVTEMEPAVHAQQWDGARHGRRRVHCEVEPARVNCDALEPWRPRLCAAEAKELLPRRAVSRHLIKRRPLSAAAATLR